MMRTLWKMSQVHLTELKLQRNLQIAFGMVLDRGETENFGFPYCNRRPREICDLQLEMEARSCYMQLTDLNPDYIRATYREKVDMEPVHDFINRHMMGICDDRYALPSLAMTLKTDGLASILKGLNFGDEKIRNELLSNPILINLFRICEIDSAFVLLQSDHAWLLSLLHMAIGAREKERPVFLGLVALLFRTFLFRAFDVKLHKMILICDSLLRLVNDPRDYVEIILWKACVRPDLCITINHAVLLAYMLTFVEKIPTQFFRDFFDVRLKRRLWTMKIEEIGLIFYLYHLFSYECIPAVRSKLDRTLNLHKSERHSFGYRSVEKYLNNK